LVSEKKTSGQTPRRSLLPSRPVWLRFPHPRMLGAFGRGFAFAVRFLLHRDLRLCRSSRGGHHARPHGRRKNREHQDGRSNDAHSRTRRGQSCTTNEVRRKRAALNGRTLAVRTPSLTTA